ncbi:hypothetical protein [Sporisorium scitamineum]|uniref:Uncharacterized protein n=1 Tax=Sporisorium scitamineum TaxID=49012 RepID=A0A0F7SDN5_9BASI|nr:hypothetical protein [Sporisorium scitamineum]
MLVGGLIAEMSSHLRERRRPHESTWEIVFFQDIF